MFYLNSGHRLNGECDKLPAIFLPKHLLVCDRLHPIPGVQKLGFK